MHRVLRSRSAGWYAALAAAAGVWLLAASPSWLSVGAGYGVREAFSLVCHQLADRSPHVHGAQWALCFRCTGLLSGLVLGLASGPGLGSAFTRLADAWGRGRLLILMGLPTTMDWLLDVTGLWANTPLSRLTTGALLGLGAGWLLATTLVSQTSSSLSTHPAI